MTKRPRCGERTRLAGQQWGTIFRDSSAEPVLSEVEGLGMTTKESGHIRETFSGFILSVRPN